MTLNLTDFKAITFDCYGTLIDWESGILATLKPWAMRNNVQVTDDQLLHAFSMSEPIWESERPGMRYPDILAAVFRDIGRRFDAAVSDEEARAFGASVKDWLPFADTPDGLAYLKRYYKLGILSNIDRASFAHTAGKLTAAFDIVVTAEEVGSYKPGAAHFEVGIARLAAIGVSRDRILHAAESLYHDHIPAQRLGLASIWVHRRLAGGGGFGASKAPEMSVVPTWEVTSIGELVDLHKRHLRASH